MSRTVEKVWTTEAGHRAVVLMYNSLGHRCGYVGLPPSHSLYQESYNEMCPKLGSLVSCTLNSPVGKRGIISVVCWDGMKPTPEIVFDVHGGITYSDGGSWENRYPIPNTGLWWFGYDCGHAGDGRDLSVLPSESRGFLGRYLSYDPVRSMEYCIKECESLSQQLEFANIEYQRLLFRRF